MNFTYFVVLFSELSSCQIIYLILKKKKSFKILQKSVILFGMHHVLPFVKLFMHFFTIKNNVNEETNSFL